MPGIFLSFLMAVGCTGGILKSACNCFLGGTVSSVYKVAVVSGSSSQGGPSENLTVV